MSGETPEYRQQESDRQQRLADEILGNPSSFAAPDGSAIRPHEEQTVLERAIRSHLWYPNDILARGAKELPKCVKAREYRQAADWQELMRKAESEKKDWEYILELYEQERKSQNDPSYQRQLRLTRACQPNADIRRVQTNNQQPKS